MLQGEEGEVKRKALEVIVKIGEVVGAERLIDVVHAHVSGISYFSIGDYGLELLEELQGSGTKVTVFTTANPYSLALTPDFCKLFEEHVIAKQRRIVDILKKMGVAESFTCTPYLLRTPKQGEHLAWAESNAVLYANSVLDAYTNREGGIVALMAAIVGKTYCGGMHLYKNRIPRVHVIVRGSIRSRVVAGLVGYKIGELVKEVPYISFTSVTPSDLPIGSIKQMLAALGTSSDLAMAVIERVTPNYREYLRRADLSKRVVINVEEIVKEPCTSSGDVLFVGCPHLDLEELKELTLLLERGLANNFREVWVGVSGKVFELGCRLRLIQKLREHGVKFAVNACPVVTKLDTSNKVEIVTDSVKAFSYIPRISGRSTSLLDPKVW